jgi:AbrB family looped-hinge helix DNA binding protein
MSDLQVEVTLRRKNQLTLPEAVARRLGVGPGDRLVIELEGGEADRALVRAVRRSYAGALAGVYGTPEEAAAYLQEERASWGG